MINGEASKAWQEMLYFPSGKRYTKPRQKGLTMVIDNGLGLGETKDLLNTAGEYIDFIKLGFGTSALYSPEVLEEKIYLVSSFGIDIYPGGTFLEIAVLQEKLEEYLHLAKNLGFTAIEVSDGVINLSSEVREQVISMAAKKGLKVLTEVGKKESQEELPVKHFARQIKRDLDSGAFQVIIEGRESGKNTGFYDSNGSFLVPALEEFLALINDNHSLIWEAPLKEQQQELILRFGPNVNLGNINPKDVLALEALRVGFRADTLKAAYRNHNSLLLQSL